MASAVASAALILLSAVPNGACRSCLVSRSPTKNSKTPRTFFLGSNDTGSQLYLRKDVASFASRNSPGHGRPGLNVKATTTEIYWSGAEVVKPKEGLSLNYDYKGQSYYPMPIIDCNGLEDSDSAIRAKLVKAIADSAKATGVVCVVNHGIPTKTLDDFRASCKKFFALPLDEKKKSDIVKEVGHLRPVGYNRQFRNLTEREFIVQRREVFEVQSIPTVNRDLVPWPAAVPELRTHIGEYSGGLGKLSVWLCEALAEGLGLSRSVFVDQIQDFHQQVVAASYPPMSLQPIEASHLGFGAHTDLAVFNIVLQDHVGGVQLYLDGKWQDTPSILDGIIFFIGDPIECMSNGHLTSTVHRVIAPKTEFRGSCITTFEPLDKDNTTFYPVPELGPPKYKPYTYGGRMSSLMGQRFDPTVMTKAFMLIDPANLDESKNFSCKDGVFCLGGIPLGNIADGY